MQNPLQISLKRFEQVLAEVMHRLPAQLGAEVVRFSMDNWKEQGWYSNRFEPWAPRKNDPKGTKRAILVKSGRLRRSIRVVRVTADSVIVGTDVPYAKVHNEGFTGSVSQNVRAHSRDVTKAGIVKTRSLKTRTNIQYGRIVTGHSKVRAHTRTVYMKIPRRQFLGDSPYLRQQLERFLATEIMRAANRI